MTPLAYLRIWLASARYSAVRAMMYRFDFFLWLAVDTLWMIVNLLFIEVVFDHTEAMAGWSKPQMLLLYGTSMLIMRLFFATAFTNLVAVDRNLREGTFDFYLAQPGNPLFMIATRMVFASPEGVFGMPARGAGGEPLIVPLAVPLIAGPSALATVMLMASREPDHVGTLAAALTATMVFATIVLLLGDRLQQWLGERAMQAIERLMGLVLTAMAVEMLLGGIRMFVQGLK